MRSAIVTMSDIMDGVGATELGVYCAYVLMAATDDPRGGFALRWDRFDKREMGKIVFEDRGSQNSSSRARTCRDGVLNVGCLDRSCSALDWLELVFLLSALGV